MMNSKSRSALFSKIAFLFVFTISLSAQAQSVEEGEKLFKSNCTACHTIGGGKLIGPDLAGINDKREADWLNKWIKNSPELIASGDADAVAIFEEFNKSPMTIFAHFSDEDVANVLSFIAVAPEMMAEAKGGVATEGGTVVESGTSDYMLLGIFLGLLLLVIALWKVKNMLKVAAEEEAKDLFQSTASILSAYLERTPLVVLTVIVLAVGGFNAAWNVMTGIGVTQGYQPEQPIAYSHKIHAGINGIDCNYCHSSARHGKTAGIPSANVCMNCHTYINQGSVTGKEEIQKIYDAVGFDPEKGRYIEGYEQKPIKWIRVHNLPDLVYFNHSQHVVAGGLECQECHGPIEEMEVVEQHSELTMGWCIKCHRSKEVKTADNAYYEEMHAKFKENHPGEKFTVEQMGGTECGKCHY
jgi:mono/diheme cytochrome c family protein